MLPESLSDVCQAPAFPVLGVTGAFSVFLLFFKAAYF